MVFQRLPDLSRHHGGLGPSNIVVDVHVFEVHQHLYYMPGEVVAPPCQNNFSRRLVTSSHNMVYSYVEGFPNTLVLYLRAFDHQGISRTCKKKSTKYTFTAT